MYVCIFAGLSDFADVVPDYLTFETRVITNVGLSVDKVSKE